MPVRASGWLFSEATSRITKLAPQERDKTLVMPQRETEVKDLAAGQFYAVIYATSMGQNPVLLYGVVHAAEK